MTATRVLFVDHASRILGGAEINLLELLEAFPEAREKKIACACPLASPLGQRLARLDLPVFDYRFANSLDQFRLVGRRTALRAGLAGWLALRQARGRLEAVLAEFQPRAVVSCTNKDHFAASAACQRRAVPSVWWVNDVLSAEFFPRVALLAFQRRARKGATRLVTVSEFARAALLRLGLPAHRTQTIHNGIPLKRYRRTEPGGLRDSLALPPQEPLIGMIGRFAPWKGQDFFLQLAERWSRRQATGHFVLIGQAFNEDQEFEAGLRRVVREKALAARVHFVPFQEAIGPALSDLTVLVHASTRPEPFGRVVIEAMAVGTPVIAARAGGVLEIITDGQDGLLAEPGNLTAYAAQLERLLGSPQLANTLARAGRATVRRSFTIERVVQNFEELLTAVTAR
ncbi:MAG: glycosyltransferase family 4 protein [Verrucomicrobia bacterium]|nr:glycosyltransferase family 4 protein [Verrucomicrobiota bacterium]